MTADGFKITYTTLTAPGEEVHRAFEAALAEVRAKALGREHPLRIGGELRTARETFPDTNPADTREVLGHIARGTARDVADAVAAARRAFAAWERRPWPDRVGALRRAAELISARRYELAALMTLEAGKTRAEALGDVEEAADLVRYYCQTIEEAKGFDRPLARLHPKESTRSVLRPYGAWAVISPFNFPLALVAGMSSGALVAGNTVVLKPASDTPLLALRYAEILEEAGMPAGTVNVVTGRGEAVGEALVRDPGVAGCVFTGSKDVGLAIYRAVTAPIPRPCILELGGKNPAIVTRAADLDTAAEGIARSAFGLSGQKCSACARVYVDRAVAAGLTERLVARTRALKVGDPTDRDVFVGPVINGRALRTFELAAAEARRDGRILVGGDVLREGPYARGFFAAPTVVAGLPRDHRLVTEELFVPFLVLQEVGSLDEAIAEANRSEYGLTAGIYSRDPAELEAFFDRLEAGVLYANRRSGATTGAWPGVNSFGGWKASGSSGKGACGPYYVAQFMREQSHTRFEGD